MAGHLSPLPSGSWIYFPYTCTPWPHTVLCSCVLCQAPYQSVWAGTTPRLHSSTSTCHRTQDKKEFRNLLGLNCLSKWWLIKHYTDNQFSLTDRTTPMSSWWQIFYKRNFAANRDTSRRSAAATGQAGSGTNGNSSCIFILQYSEKNQLLWKWPSL